MSSSLILAVFVSAFGALTLAAILLLMRHRERMRAAGREAESLNVTSNDTRRAFWFSTTDHSGPSDHGSSSGDGGGD